MVSCQLEGPKLLSQTVPAPCQFRCIFHKLLSLWHPLQSLPSSFLFPFHCALKKTCMVLNKTMDWIFLFFSYCLIQFLFLFHVVFKNIPFHFLHSFPYPHFKSFNPLTLLFIVHDLHLNNNTLHTQQFTDSYSFSDSYCCKISFFY